MSVNPEDIKRSVEIDRLIKQVNLHRMRSEYIEAEDVCRQALALDESRADVRELLGDVLYDRGQLEDAMQEYKQVKESGPGFASAETKYAKVVLEIGQNEYERRIMKEMLDNPKKYVEGPKHPLLAFILSALVPGMGQVYNREIVKGAILIGAFLLSLLVLALSPIETGNLLKAVGVLLYPTASDAPKNLPIGPLVVLFAAVLVFIYIYAVIDAAIGAAKTPDAKRKSAEP